MLFLDVCMANMTLELLQTLQNQEGEGFRKGCPLHFRARL